jgi:hypothetical protein
MKPISVYCEQEVDGWVKLPVFLNMAFPGQEDYTCSFLNQKEGIHLLASVKDFGVLQQVHVSLAPIMAYRKDKTESEMVEEIVYRAGDIIQEFFGDLDFCRAPDDQRRPSVKHFFHIIDKE